MNEVRVKMKGSAEVVKENTDFSIQQPSYGRTLVARQCIPEP